MVFGGQLAKNKDKWRIDRDKTMLMIVWNTRGFNLINVMFKRVRYNACYFINKILILIYSQMIPEGRCKLIIHADNFQCQTAKVWIKFVSWKQSDLPLFVIFYRFDTIWFLPFRFVEARVSELLFRIANELCAELHRLIGDISPQILLKLFHEQIVCYKHVITMDWD